MVSPSYRPDHDVTFDLQHGLVHLEGAPGCAIVPAEALAILAAAAGAEASAAFGAACGRAMGVRVLERLAPLAGPGEEAASGSRAASADTWLDHLGTEWALAGLGSLGLERWGDALVVVVDHCPLGGPDTNDARRAILEGAIGAAIRTTTGKNAVAVWLMHDRTRLRFAVTSPAASARVASWIAEGCAWGDVLARLHAPEPADLEPNAGPRGDA